MLTESGVSIDHIFTIRFIGIAGITILIITVVTLHGIPPDGRMPGIGAGDTVGTHPTLTEDGDIRPIIIVTGIALIMHGVIHITDTVVIMEVITEVITIVSGMPIQKTTVTEKEDRLAQMFCVVPVVQEELKALQLQEIKVATADRKVKELLREGTTQHQVEEMLKYQQETHVQLNQPMQKY